MSATAHSEELDEDEDPELAEDEEEARVEEEAATRLTGEGPDVGQHRRQMSSYLSLGGTLSP